MCKPHKDPAAVKLGRKGGKAGTGKAKSRDSEVMRRAALKRWEYQRLTRSRAAKTPE